jgi:drug/metabolite transporter (DMT)-like permease
MTATTQTDHPAASAEGAAPSFDWLALGAALVTVVLWASAFVGIRAVADDLDPGPFALGRLLVASAALGVLMLVRRPALPPARRDWGLIAASGVVWFGLYFVVLNAGEQLVDAGTAAMLVNVGPILIALFAGVFLREGFPPRLLLGSGIAFAGTVIIAAATGIGSAQSAAPLGVLLCLAAALAYASGVTIQKPAVARVPALTVTAFACWVGTIVTLPFAPGLVDAAGSADAETIGWVVYLGIFPTAIGFVTWAFALNRTSAGRLGSTTYLVSPIAIVMAWFLLGETPVPLALLGGALAIAGVVVARSSGRSVLSFRRRTA